MTPLTDEQFKEALGRLGGSYWAPGNRGRMTIPELIASLEAAHEGSRELSDEVLLAYGWGYYETGKRWLTDPKGQAWYAEDRPDPTRSVDDVLALARNNREVETMLLAAIKEINTFQHPFKPYRAWPCIRAALIAILKARLK